MKSYSAPEIKVTAFSVDEVITASFEPTKITGGSNGVLLPDDEWSEE